MLPGRCNVGSMLAVFISQGASHSIANGFGIGDDPGHWLT